jgi:hypothetical protein
MSNSLFDFIELWCPSLSPNIRVHASWVQFHTARKKEVNAGIVNMTSATFAQPRALPRLTCAYTYVASPRGVLRLQVEFKIFSVSKEPLVPLFGGAELGTILRIAFWHCRQRRLRCVPSFSHHSSIPLLATMNAGVQNPVISLGAMQGMFFFHFYSYSL